VVGPEEAAAVIETFPPLQKELSNDGPIVAQLLDAVEN
jgi:hypothetical protein